MILNLPDMLQLLGGKMPVHIRHSGKVNGPSADWSG